MGPWDARVVQCALAKGFRMDLSNIRVLYRDLNCQLWGIPYDLRSQQSPRDLERAGNTQGWIWLGSPGWWGSMSKDDQHSCQSFLTQHTEIIPGNPYEWDTVPIQNPQTRFTWQHDGYVYEIVDARGYHILVADYRYGTEYIVVDTTRLFWDIAYGANALNKARTELEKRAGV